MATKKSTISQEVTEAFDEVKETAADVGGRREYAETEEKVTTILGIVLFARGLWFLRGLIGGILLLLIGGLLIGGFLNEPIANLLKRFNSPKQAKAKPKTTKKTSKK